MKSIQEQVVYNYCESGAIGKSKRYKVLESCTGGWQLARYINWKFEEVDAIFPTIEQAIAFCEGKVGVIKNAEKMLFDDFGNLTEDKRKLK